ncbi:MAG: phosphoribosylamine--glycine ligase [Bacteriovoracaceae bacterium]|nr:phosphoribosylamine--glycine ligase [Bacteriovoracaceae bacterium]
MPTQKINPHTLLVNGSVKDIYQPHDAGGEKELIFRFSDRYSVFDWGEMPNALVGKGAALAKMGESFFKHLGEDGVKHHFLSYDGKNDLRVKKIYVPRDKGMSVNEFYQTRPTQTLIPLECLFRFGLPEGSSLAARMGAVEENWKLAGFKRAYRPGELWEEGENIFVEFSTKLEKQDRLLSDKEAKELSGCSEREWNQLLNLVRVIASKLKQVFFDRGIVLWDGKVEFAFGDQGQGQGSESEREIILVDSIGLDELRLTFEGHSVSKEILRQMYRKTPWYEALVKSKEVAGNDFKKYCQEILKEAPVKLPQKIIDVVVGLYEGIASLVALDPNKDKSSLEKIQQTLRNQLRLIDAWKNPDEYKNILIIGGGGREHGMALRMLQDQSMDEKKINIFVMPGNPGMELVEGIFSLGGSVHVETISDWKKYFPIEFCVIGPEQYIYGGLKQSLVDLGIPTVAPSKEAGMLEESKIFSKQFMEKHKIPTAGYVEFSSVEKALAELKSLPRDWSGYVIKLSGPAQGKGVFVLDTLDEVQNILEELKNHPMQGQEAGLVIEEKWVGRECSLFYACMGSEYKYLGEACDHKRLLEGDLGPNTGGMGAISPVPWLSEDDRFNIEANFLRPTLVGLDSQKIPFSGFLFLGLMQDQKKGFQLLEYNVRLGDPETQTFLCLMEGPFVKLLHALANEEKDHFKAIEIKRRANLFSCHVVKVAKGYPGVFGEAVEKGKEVKKVMDNKWDGNQDNGFAIFAGLKAGKNSKNETVLLTDGGRVMGVTAIAHNLKDAQFKAYDGIKSWDFEGSYYRKDIGENHV